MSSLTQKLVVTVVTLGLVGFFGYSFFLSISGSGPSSSSALDNSSVSLGTGVVGQDISALVAKLKSVSIDTSLFSSPLFSNLKDISTPIIPEPQGRPNPFASVGSDGYFVSTPVLLHPTPTSTPLKKQNKNGSEL